VTPRMTIGEFSRATHLSAKTLRFYHQARILEPAAVDPSSGYRLYGTEQVVDAQVVRHLRSLEVPVETVREILSAPGVEARNALVAAHLESMEARLATTLAAVTSLRALLTHPAVDLAVEHRSCPATPVVAVRETIDLADLSAWFTGAVAELATATGPEANRPVGPRGGLWDTDLFLVERGEAVLFYPVASLDGVVLGGGRLHTEVLPAVDVAVAVHSGRDETIGQTYGALGAYVAEHEIGVDGPVRENYLRDPAPGSPDVVTEICWPIFRTTR